MMSEVTFTCCSKCSQTWEERDAFLSDPHVNIVGYQVQFDELLEGLFMFNHSCGTTISLRAGLFRDLYDGEVFEECQLSGDDCPKLCLHNDNLEPCPARCECTFVRQIIQRIKSWPKAAMPTKTEPKGQHAKRVITYH